ncbi:hypothetical protein KGR20_11685 [Cytobacillus oceanisediminis]|uniref:hypothetical protein n=1 Tax=Bacillaceae TaxID=186817 RepID=UPI001CCB8609|nr:MULTISPECIES: hypothetical protein [Bacillaceae]MBZ9534903.1 hypothetical protein [Cytobacillus oceanisediminis]UTI44402.1 hypothetical protein NKG37_12730 [Niallia sp. RD1]
MKLKAVSSTGKALTELTPEQQQRFISQLAEQQDENIKFGMELSLMILGYEVVEGEE